MVTAVQGFSTDCILLRTSFDSTLPDLSRDRVLQNRIEIHLSSIEKLFPDIPCFRLPLIRGVSLQFGKVQTNKTRLDGD